MEVIKTVKVILTEEEREILEKAQNILGNFEMENNREVLDLLEDRYKDSVYIGSCTALATAIDLLDVILEDYRNEDDEKEEEEDEI